MYQILEAAACISCDAARLQRIADLAAAQTDWQALIGLADGHGLTPLLFRNLQESGARMPAPARRQLHGIYLSHRHANQQRREALRQLLDACAAEGIRAVLLKGGALSLLLYPDPALRPMSDLDIMVPREQALQAQAILGQLSFHVPPAHHSRWMKGHHHLPGATRSEDGMLLAVEVHVDALSHDCPDPMTLADLDAPLQAFDVGGSPAWTLGHVDMLRQLVWHALGPADRLRLIWVVDVLEYAARFAAEIDWAQLAARRPELLNALSLFAQVLPLPAVLQDKVPRYRPDPVPGAGVVCQPLSRIFSSRRGRLQRLRDLYYPSDWWLRAFYGVATGGSLFWCRWVTHTRNLARWFLRRLASAAG